MSSDKQRPRRLRSTYSSLTAHGEPWVWLTGGAQATAIMMITGLLAFIATRIDEAAEPEAGLIAAVRELHAIPELGSANFLLSCGQQLYAHRLGRSLHVLARQGDARTASITIASEQLTDERWDELPERSLWAVDSTSVRRLL